MSHRTTLEAVRCPFCGEAPVIAPDSAGLSVQAFIVWCDACNKDRASGARGLTPSRAIEVWNDNIMKAMES